MMRGVAMVEKLGRPQEVDTVSLKFETLAEISCVSPLMQVQ